MPGVQPFGPDNQHACACAAAAAKTAGSELHVCCIRVAPEDEYLYWLLQWEGGKYEGFGVETFPSGGTYHGGYAAGCRSGWGACSFANGDTFEGEWNGFCAAGVLASAAGQITSCVCFGGSAGVINNL